MTRTEDYEEEVFQEENYEEDYRDERCIYEQRWWDRTFYEDPRFL